MTMSVRELCEKLRKEYLSITGEQSYQKKKSIRHLMSTELWMEA